MPFATATARSLSGASLLVARRLVEAGRAVHQRACRNLRQQRALVRHARKQFRHAQKLQPADSRPGLPGARFRTSTNGACSIRRWWS